MAAKPATRRRLSADEARARILEAAERKLAEVGPEGLRLTELAGQLGISHPAILHHFGSREVLVGAVIERATARLDERLTALMDRQGSHGTAVFDAIAEFYSAQGNARLLAWLVMSGLTASGVSRSGAAPALRHLIEAAHAQRKKASPRRDIDYRDTEFRSQLIAFALLGEAIFGDIIRVACDSATGPDAARDFRQRIAKLLF